MTKLPESWSKLLEQPLAPERPEVGDTCQFWRRSPGGKSEHVMCEVLEITDNWTWVRRLDTGEERYVDARRLKVLKKGTAEGKI